MTRVERLARPVRLGARRFSSVMVMVAAVSSCATTGVPGGAMRSRTVGTDDRVVVRCHTDVLGVAASTRLVYVLSTRGLLLYDRVLSRWRAPSSRVDDDLELAGVARLRNAVLAADPMEEAVWIGVPGALVLYRAQIEQVQRITVVGQPELIAFARGDTDAYVRASGQWLRISRAGFVTPLVGGIGNVTLVWPPQLGEVYQQYPALRGQLPFLLRDESAPAGGFASVTSGTLSPDQSSDVWIGTRNDGLWRVDANFMHAERLRYGVLDDMIGAVAPGGEGVWTAGQGSARGGGLTFVHNDLQRFTWIDGGASAAFAGVRTTALAVRASRVWAGTDRGVVRVQLGAPTGVTAWGALHGLPSDVVSAIVPRDNGAWVATSRGLAFIRDTSSNLSVRTDAIPVALVGQPVRSLLLVADTLLIGANDGLYVLSAREPLPDGGGMTPRRVWSAQPALDRPVQALATSDSLLLVVTDRRAVILSLREVIRPSIRPERGSVDSVLSRELISERDLASVGTVVAAAMDERSIWIAGSRGVLALARDGGVLRVLSVGTELPGDVTALALDDEWAWVGTNNGLVRVRRARAGGLP